MRGAPPGELTADSAPKLARKALLRWDRRDKVFILIYPERGLVLNETASAILRLCDGRRSVRAIAEELGGKESDVIAFLCELRARGLVQVAS